MNQKMIIMNKYFSHSSRIEKKKIKRDLRIGKKKKKFPDHFCIIALDYVWFYYFWSLTAEKKEKEERERKG